ncbi:hypothetical protein N803_11460 [Knoellia subterranea KCTC 19937]|uniref:DUF5666 domain-containing protein n=1 Tax=Knoellia subterranea KCTC 19937 TaxID=1385521 RepID=A0A0A0JNN9_9MICO|nr:hypothetical protein N803_11460 [Knoellia subterranea KCTC 19937]
MAPQASPPGAQASPAQSQAQGVPGQAPRSNSTWGEATSTTGGKIAIAIAAASLGFILLVGTGLAAFAVVRHADGDRGRGPWAGSSERAPMPDRMYPGDRGPNQLPPGQLPGQRGNGQDDNGADELPGAGGLGLGPGLHGELVIPGDNGSPQTVLFQRGDVTEVTADKLTVKSTDGFTSTYTIGADSQKRLKDKVSTLAAGDQVAVVADKGTTTTLRILKTGRAAATS